MPILDTYIIANRLRDTLKKLPIKTARAMQFMAEKDPYSDTPVYEKDLPPGIFGFSTGLPGMGSLAINLSKNMGAKQRENILRHEAAHSLLTDAGGYELSQQPSPLAVTPTTYGGKIKTPNMNEYIAQLFANEDYDNPAWSGLDEQVLKKLFPTEKRKHKNVKK